MSLPLRLTHFLSLCGGLLLLVLLSFSGQAVNQATAAPDGDPLAIFLHYLDQNRAQHGLVAADLTDYVVTDMYQTRDTAVSHIYLRQQINGIDIITSHANANILPDGTILSVNVAFAPNLDRTRYDGQPALNAAEAANAVADELRLPIREYFFIEESFGGAEQAVILTDGGISEDPIPARLVYVETERDGLRLAWELLIDPLNRPNYWQIAADATTGEILLQFDWLVEHNMADIALAEPRPLAERTVIAPDTAVFPPFVHPENSTATGGTYRVFGLPYESPTAPGAVHSLVASPAHPVASPYGWHDTNGVAGPEFTITRGNNVHAYLDTNGSNFPDPGSEPNGGAGLVFDWAFDPTLPPSGGTNPQAAVVNLFYWNNISHDLLYVHGFDEVSGNFQVNNYGRGGVGNDDVLAEGQDGGGINNANFNTPPDGFRPRMQMYNWNTTTPNRDGDFDAGIIAHEYGHGWSNRLTGGPNNVSCLDRFTTPEQMGEGWSDFLTVVFTAQASDTRTTNRGVGTYALGQPPTGNGIRPAPYNTDMAVNWYTYDNLPSMAVPHGVGFVWNTMLWEMYWNLVDEYGFNPNLYEDWSTGGNNLALRLVTDGLKLQPCSPGFVDGRDAILAADVALTSGQNQCTIWESFAKRGLGFSADQGSSGSRTDGTAAFDLPNACVTFAEGTNSVNICQGQEAVYTIGTGLVFTGDIQLNAFGNPAPSMVTFVPNPLTAGNEAIMTVSNTDDVPFNAYDITVMGDDGVVTDTLTVELTVASQVPDTAVLQQPANAADNVPLNPSLSWTASAQAASYLVEVATDADFTTIVYSDTVMDTIVDLSGLSSSTVYYWRVTAGNSCGTAVVSSTFAFRTEALVGECSIDQTTQVLLSEGFESGAPGWTTGGTGNTWAASNARVYSGDNAFHAANVNFVSDQRLISPPIELTAGFDSYALTFWNYQIMESRDAGGCWDGGIIEISTNGGGSWAQVSSSTHPYDGLIQTGFSNPLGGLQGWCGEPRPWHRPVVELDAYEGETVNFRFRLGTDNTVAREGWYVDDVTVQACAAAPSDVAVELAAPNDAQTADADTTVSYTVNISNTGILADSFDLEATSGLGWNTAVFPTAITLDPGQSGSFTVEVTTPADAAGGTVDQISVKTMAQSDIFINDAVELTLTINHPIAPEMMPMQTLVTVNTSRTAEIMIHNAGGSDLVWTLAEDTGANDCAGDLPWLTSTPMMGTTPKASSTPVSLTFDATGYAEGDHIGSLCLLSNDPDQPQRMMLVTMTVSAAGVMLGADQAQHGLPGETVMYTVVITNTGPQMDTFDVTLGGSSWLTEVAPTEIELAGETAGELVITVAVPEGADAGEMDMVLVTAVSRLDDQMGDTAHLTTIAGAQYTFDLTSDATTQTAEAGQTITYTISLTNTGNITDSYTVMLSGNSWETIPSLTNLTLAAGESASFYLAVDIPTESASAASSDLAVLMVHSEGDDSLNATLNITTARLQTEFNLYLPVVSRP